MRALTITFWTCWSAAATLALYCVWMILYDSPEITRAIGVVSQCGIYAVATIDSSGAVEVYSAAREAPAAVEAIVNALPPEARTAVLVPCPLAAQIPSA